jgi:CubicO group peptidase (beta-lactamase class C family)
VKYPPRTVTRSSWDLHAAALIALALAAPSARAADVAPQIDAYVKPLVDAGQFSGCILAVRDGKVVYERAFGMADVERRAPNTIDTRFCIASVTKSMTAALAIRLIDEKKLAASDSIARWISDFPRGNEITVGLLLRHQSGIPNRVTTDQEETQRTTSAAIVEKAKRAPLAFTPGEKRLYSSTGYSVLARVLELAAGKSYSSLLEKYIFKPAHMTETVDFDGKRKIPHRAHEYLLQETGLVPAPTKDYSFLVGAGSLFSTVRDVRRFCDAVLDSVYGNGVRLSLSQNGQTGANGAVNGYRCFAAFDRGEGYGLVVASNLESGANDLLQRDLPQILAGKAVPAPVVPNPTPVELDAARLNDYVGTYDMSGSTFEVLVEGDHLYAGRFRLMPIGNDRFFSCGGYAEIVFFREGALVTGLSWSGPVGSSEWRRLP